LVAGGGTGDATIMLAAQMAALGQPGTVTYLDRSDAAMRIAQARSAARGLDNILWEQRSLLDLPGAGLGPFDYIDCCGVLHHLPDPAGGLRALLSVLAPGGGMGLMVYAPHGRTGVYMLQDALRLIAPPDQPPAVRLDAAKRVMRALPPTHWLRLNRAFADHVSGGDAGLYDLLLNPRDRAFDIPALFALLDGAGLSGTLMEPARYDPATWLPDAKLRGLAATLDPVGRAALAEGIAGTMSTHVVYCRRAAEPLEAADPMAEEAVPVPREAGVEGVLKALRPDGTFPFAFDGTPVQVALPHLATPILRLVDGKRSVGAIAAEMAARGTDRAAFLRAWREIWDKLSGLNRMGLAPPP
jgi:SAM-dependent methyltransferase